MVLALSLAACGGDPAGADGPIARCTPEGYCEAVAPDGARAGHVCWFGEWDGAARQETCVDLATGERTTASVAWDEVKERGYQGSGKDRWCWAYHVENPACCDAAGVNPPYPEWDCSAEE